MVAPYEVELMKNARGTTVHVDATYKVINPAKDSGEDFRSASQLISFTVKSDGASKRMLLRGLFCRPRSREMYSKIFDDFLFADGLPSATSYAGFAGDFSTSQLESFILSFIKYDRDKKGLKKLGDDVILSDSKLVYEAASFFRGCGVKN